MTEKWSTSQISKFGSHQGTWFFNKSSDAPWQNGVVRPDHVSEEITSDSNWGKYVKPECIIGLGTYLCLNDLLLGRASNTVPSRPMVDTADAREQFSLIQSIVTSVWKWWMRD